MPALNTPGRQPGQDLNPKLGQLQPMAKHDWERQLEALPLGSIVKLVGFALAHSASKDGSSARPGIRRLMWATEIRDERTVSRALRRLRTDGLIYLCEAGGGRGKGARADCYQLTTHGQVPRWTVSYEQWRDARESGEDGDDPWS